MFKAIKKLFSKAPKAEPPKAKAFLPLMTEFLQKLEIDQNLCDSTMIRYRGFQRRIDSYFKQAGLAEIAVDEVRVRHMEDLRIYLKRNTGATKQTWVSRHIEMCKRVMNYAVLMEYTKNNPLGPIRRVRDKLREVTALSIDELSRIREYKFQSEAIQKAADRFLFQAFTGISVSDLANFKIETRQGKQWLIGNRNKTGAQFIVPVFPPVTEILNKYNGALPSQVDQSYNYYLKEVAAITGISKHLTSHVGRKTFASLLDESGISTKTIAEALGNTQAVAELHYLQKSTARVQNEFERVGVNLNVISKAS